MAPQVNELVPTIIERRSGKDDPVLSRLARRGAVKQYHDSAATAPVAKITITSPSPPLMNVAQTFQLSVQVEGWVQRRDADGAFVPSLEVLTGRTVTYATSNGSVATVNSSGLITAAGGGSCTITATCEGASVTQSVTVNNPQPAVNNLTVNPSSGTIQVGSSAQFQARVRDASNNILTGKTVTWSEVTGASLITTGSDSGDENHQVTVTATGEGSASIKATCESVDSPTISLNLTAAPVPPTGGDNPNEPAGYTQIVNHDMGTFPGPWFVNANAASPNGATAQTDGTAPYSPPSVTRIRYPAGFSDQNIICEFGKIIEPGVKRLYIHYRFKCSANWQGHNSNTNKLFYVNGELGGPEMWPIFVSMGCTGTGGTPTIDLRFQGLNQNPNAPNYTGGPAARDTWHRFEVLLIGNTPGQPDGEGHLWLNGTKYVTATGLNIFSASVDGKFHGFSNNPVWGGNSNDVMSQTQDYLIDHVYISGKTT